MSERESSPLPGPSRGRTTRNAGPGPPPKPRSWGTKPEWLNGIASQRRYEEGMEWLWKEWFGRSLAEIPISDPHAWMKAMHYCWHLGLPHHFGQQFLDQTRKNGKPSPQHMAIVSLSRNRIPDELELADEEDCKARLRSMPGKSALTLNPYSSTMLLGGLVSMFCAGASECEPGCDRCENGGGPTKACWRMKKYYDASFSPNRDKVYDSDFNSDTPDYTPKMDAEDRKRFINDGACMSCVLVLYHNTCGLGVRKKAHLKGRNRQDALPAPTPMSDAAERMGRLRARSGSRERAEQMGYNIEPRILDQGVVEALPASETFPFTHAVGQTVPAEMQVSVAETIRAKKSEVKDVVVCVPYQHRTDDSGWNVLRRQAKAMRDACEEINRRLKDEAGEKGIWGFDDNLEDQDEEDEDFAAMP